MSKYCIIPQEQYIPVSKMLFSEEKCWSPACHTHGQMYHTSVHTHTHTFVILSYHPSGIQLGLDSVADKTGGSSFVLSRARTEESWPDGSVHHVSSLVPLPQLISLEPLSQQCALSSVEVMVHMNEEKRGAPDGSRLAHPSKQEAQDKITRFSGHMSDSTIALLFITLIPSLFPNTSNAPPPETQTTSKQFCLVSAWTPFSYFLPS